MDDRGLLDLYCLIVSQNLKPGFTRLNGSCYRPGVAPRVGTGIALLYYDRGTRRRVSGQQHALAQFTSGKDLVPILQEAGWVPGAGLDGRKISSPPGFDPGPSSP